MNSREVTIRFEDGRTQNVRINASWEPQVIAYGFHFFVPGPGGVYTECTVSPARGDLAPIQPPANTPWVGKALQTREG